MERSLHTSVHRIHGLSDMMEATQKRQKGPLVKTAKWPATLVGNRSKFQFYLNIWNNLINPTGKLLQLLKKK